ncbi:MAG: aminoacyl-tRNA hydrolase [Clostridia bacterium]|nr:aminoacyl-tRNA hydrolase [Clostridia bacterium]
MFIIVGLGNPGREYEGTRHNTGFMVMDRLAEKYKIEVKKQKCKALLGQGEIEGEKVLLVKPQTYMNLSGQAVAEVVNFYKEDLENLVIVFDDIDLPVGKLRIKERGSAGTHNGMKSIVSSLGTTEFKRVKVGIGKQMPGEDLANYVLGTFQKEERDLLADAMENAVGAIETMIREGVSAAMNRFN